MIPGKMDKKIAEYIIECFEDTDSWEKISNLEFIDENGRSDFFSDMHRLSRWPIMNLSEWRERVAKVRKEHEDSESLPAFDDDAMISIGPGNTLKHSSGKNSAWQEYLRVLKKNGFSELAIENISDATEKTLQQLKRDNRGQDPVRGMVIGNVQSGKTANMAGLMATAADNGFNFFVVLTGSIENLREQTEKRLKEDLNTSTGAIRWEFLNNLKKSSPDQLAQKNLYGLGEDSRGKNPYAYVYVCLKNSTRLKGFLSWLNTKDAKQANLRILVIDDEADQAGINTEKIANKKRTKINELICNLVYGKNDSGAPMNSQYQAMNYIGYTATPYANVLNETGNGTLYPASFIQMQKVSNEYFGPQQIFGMEQGLYSPELELPEYDGMDILPEINDEDIEIIKRIQKGENIDLPETLKDAVLWFLCSVSALRTQKYQKPLSLLIHTSAKTEEHEQISEAVTKWLNTMVQEPEQLIEHCHSVYDEQTRQFSLEKFKEQCFWYGSKDNVQDYPQFEEIEKELRELISENVKHIAYFDDEGYKFSTGIHLCVDNSKNNGIDLTHSHLRLVYPRKEEMPEKAPAFIVVGGTTLSRGLTIEGLVSSYFLRSAQKVDSLMQMGRWFGYRKQYELYPRIWLPEEIREYFKFTSSLDFELRKEVIGMEKDGISPSDSGPRVIESLNNAKCIESTARNKRQSATETKILYDNLWSYKPQTTKFYEDRSSQIHNENALRNFLDHLPGPEKVKNALLWKDVRFADIMSFLNHYQTPDDQFAQEILENLESWISKEKTKYPSLMKWNIILAGKEKGNGWSFSKGTINKTTRSRHLSSAGKLNIKALVDPADYLLDIPQNHSQELKEKINRFKKQGTTIDKGISGASLLRREAGTGMTPLMVIYVVDKDGSIRKNSLAAINTYTDLVGVSLLIPDNPDGTGGSLMSKKYIRIPLEKMKNDNRTDI